MRTAARSVFVVIEGIDRVGKGKQADLLAGRLEAAAFETPCYKTAIGEVIDLFLRRQVTTGGELRDAVVLQALQVANRVQIGARIKGLLAGGTSVVCSRWWTSSVVYGMEDGMGPQLALEAAVLLPEPDVWILLDVPLDVVAGRLDRDKRYESDVGLQGRLARCYLEFWQNQRRHPDQAEKWWVISQDEERPQGPDEVAEMVWRAVCRARPDLAEKTS